MSFPLQVSTGNGLGDVSKLRTKGGPRQGSLPPSPAGSWGGKGLGTRQGGAWRARQGAGRRLRSEAAWMFFMPGCGHRSKVVPSPGARETPQDSLSWEPGGQEESRVSPQREGSCAGGGQARAGQGWAVQRGGRGPRRGRGQGGRGPRRGGGPRRGRGRGGRGQGGGPAGRAPREEAAWATQASPGAQHPHSRAASRQRFHTPPHSPTATHAHTHTHTPIPPPHTPIHTHPTHPAHTTTDTPTHITTHTLTHTHTHTHQPPHPHTPTHTHTHPTHTPHTHTRTNPPHPPTHPSTPPHTPTHTHPHTHPHTHTPHIHTRPPTHTPTLPCRERRQTRRWVVLVFRTAPPLSVLLMELSICHIKACKPVCLRVQKWPRDCARGSPRKQKDLPTVSIVKGQQKIKIKLCFLTALLM